MTDTVVNLAIKKAIKLKLFPEGVYSPSPLSAVWNMFISDRSSGKTTAWLIVGLIAYIDYGIVTHYVRSVEKMIRESAISDIYTVIVDKGYISAITNGKYNSICYQRNKRGFYLRKIDDTGKVIDVDEVCCCKVMSIDNSDIYKSSYQCDTADLVVYDEFINIYYRSGEFVKFCDLLSTLFRKRLTGTIVMLANTIDRRSEYFDEIGCRNFINSAEQGDVTNYDIDGTTVHVEVLGTKLTHKRKMFNARYFAGFANKQLRSITGTGWAIKSCQHIARMPSEYVLTNVFLHHQNNYIQLQLVVDDVLGYVIHACPYTGVPKDDAYIYSMGDDFSDSRYVYKTGFCKFDKYIWDLRRANKWFYANNEVYSVVESYTSLC